MKIISRSMLREHWERPDRADSEQPLRAWLKEAESAEWKTPQDVKDKFKSASIIGDNRVVFNIAGNKYRLVVHIRYSTLTALTKFVGTHKEYDAIDAEKI